MCFRSRRQPEITESQKKQEEAAEAAKAKAAAEKEKLRQEQLEAEKQKQLSAAAKQQGQAMRQSELGQLVGGGASLTGTGLTSAKSTVGTGTGPRRSLITSSGSGAGYYTRFS